MDTRKYEIVDSVEKLESALARIRAAQKQYSTYSQEQVDAIFQAAAIAADNARIRYTCDCLRERGMIRLGACHCSGPRASEYFQEHFPGFFLNNVGSRVEVE